MLFGNLNKNITLKYDANTYNISLTFITIIIIINESKIIIREIKNKH